ncbi:hypothetical protein [Aureimonas psammosilenae]|uniref:hypothetical protein n=1 Tax=Aureimonas psammosilenae TaxID=2495496 RepID=UPI001260CEB3|nr:hypothetical protein [Aureimonas psammosilenae]
MATRASKPEEAERSKKLRSVPASRPGAIARLSACTAALSCGIEGVESLKADRSLKERLVATSLEADQRLKEAHSRQDAERERPVAGEIVQQAERDGAEGRQSTAPSSTATRPDGDRPRAG